MTASRGLFPLPDGPFHYADRGFVGFEQLTYEAEVVATAPLICAKLERKLVRPADCSEYQLVKRVSRNENFGNILYLTIYYISGIVPVGQLTVYARFLLSNRIKLKYQHLEGVLHLQVESSNSRYRLTVTSQRVPARGG